METVFLLDGFVRVRVRPVLLDPERREVVLYDVHLQRPGYKNGRMKIFPMELRLFNSRRSIPPRDESAEYQAAYLAALRWHWEKSTPEVKAPMVHQAAYGKTPTPTEDPAVTEVRRLADRVREAEAQADQLHKECRTLANRVLKLRNKNDVMNARKLELAKQLHKLKSGIDGPDGLLDGHWTDAQGVRRAITELDDSHLLNILIWIEERGLRLYKFGEIVAEAQRRGLLVFCRGRACAPPRY